MSIQPKPTQLAPGARPEPAYFSAERATVAPLRPLTPVEQMYAYWGSDLAA